jgi:hypothetical protein
MVELPNEEVHTGDHGIEDYRVEISAVRPAYSPKFPVEKDFGKAFGSLSGPNIPLNLINRATSTSPRQTIIKLDMESMSSDRPYLYNIVQHAITPKAESYSAAPSASLMPNRLYTLAQRASMPQQHRTFLPRGRNIELT